MAAQHAAVDDADPMQRIVVRHEPADDGVLGLVVSGELLLALDHEATPAIRVARSGAGRGGSPRPSRRRTARKEAVRIQECKQLGCPGSWAGPSVLALRDTRVARRWIGFSVDLWPALSPDEA